MLKTRTTIVLGTSLLLSAPAMPVLADDPAYTVAAFIAGIQGDGFVGDQESEEGASWNFPSEEEGSLFIHSVEETPFSFEDVAVNPSGAGTYGMASCITEVEPEKLTLYGSALAMVDARGSGEFADSYAQVHGEFHLSIDEPVKLAYHLCNDTDGFGTSAQLHIRKLVNGNFQPLVSNHTSSNQGIECVDGMFIAEPGYYQLYFSGYANTHNGSNGALDHNHGSADFVAILDITPHNVADINGDGVVDGKDLTRLLGSWGSSATGADLNGDGVVDGQDLAILLAAWS